MLLLPHASLTLNWAQIPASPLDCVYCRLLRLLCSGFVWCKVQKQANNDRGHRGAGHLCGSEDSNLRPINNWSSKVQLRLCYRCCLNPSQRIRALEVLHGMEKPRTKTVERDIRSEVQTHGICAWFTNYTLKMICYPFFASKTKCLISFFLNIFLTFFAFIKIKFIYLKFLIPLNSFQIKGLYHKIIKKLDFWFIFILT